MAPLAGARDSISREAMLRCASSRSLGTRGAHPSAKFTPRAISGPSPQGHPTLARPLGGAGSARPLGNAFAPPGHLPARPPHLGSPPWRGGLRTPIIPASRLTDASRFEAVGSLCGVPVSRRGGLCTPAMSELASPGHVPARRPHLGSPPRRGGLCTPAIRPFAPPGHVPFNPPPALLPTTSFHPHQERTFITP